MRPNWLIVWLFAGVASLPSARPSQAQEHGKAPPAGEMLGHYLLEQARGQFMARRRAIAAIKTPEDVARRQNAMRAFLLGSLGDLPERTPLNGKVVGTLSRDGYRVDKVIFESRPAHHVTANLYLPAGKPPFPGVLIPCGHSDSGKAYESYQRVCISLAKNGMAALCYDPIGQGERLQLLDAAGKPVVRNTTEHTMEGIGALLVGRHLAGYHVWDGLRALDYLAGRAEIDPDRLGCTGNSGGGTSTAYLMALDDRIKVAAPSCFITSLERLFATIGPQDAEQNITGDVAAGMDHADYVMIRAPKPTLITVGTRDYFDIQGSWDTFREVKLIYGRLGFGERVDLFESDEVHGFTRPRRIATVRWMRRWLLKSDDAVDEPDFPVASDAELQCTRTGQVLGDFKDELSVFDLNRQRQEALKVARDAANKGRSTAEFRELVKRRIGLIDETARPLKPQLVSRSRSGSHTIRKLVFEVEPGLLLPVVEISRDGRGDRGPTVVKVGADWKDELDPGRDIEKVLPAGARLVLFDPRGMGETRPTAAKEPRSPFGVDWKEAFISIHLARPLLGQRVNDLLRVLASMAAESSHAGFHLVGLGAAGPVVLHAGLLDDQNLIKQLTLERSLVSWADLLQKGISKDQLGNVVPGSLQDYDLPDLVARLGTDRVTIRSAVDAVGEPIAR